jgi:hypothetical protein
MQYPEGVAAYMRRRYLAKVIAAALCAPQEDNDEDNEEDGDPENGVFIES